MRTFFKSLVLASLFLSLAYSCSDDSSSGGVPSLGKVNATIDGKSWEGTNGVGTISTQSTISSLIIGGSKIDIKNPTNMELISVVVYSGQGASLAVGDYSVGVDAFPKGQFTYQIGTGTDNYWYSTSGTVSISKITDTNFQGTFSGAVTKSGNKEGEAAQTKTITNGGFNVNKSQY